MPHSAAFRLLRTECLVFWTLTPAGRPGLRWPQLVQPLTGLTMACALLGLVACVQPETNVQQPETNRGAATPGSEPLVNGAQQVTLAPLSGNFSPAVPMPSVPLQEDRLIQRIALGSCFKQRADDAIFGTVQQSGADLFMFLGDNVYAETEADDPELASLKAAYAELAGSAAFASLRQTMPVMATWDDHDYGLNDAGGDWPWRNRSEALFEHAWAVPAEDPRAAREGVYYARTVGPEGRRVQLIVLDTRSFRSPLMKPAIALSQGRYVPQTESGQQMLGEAQWQWLEQQLRKPAALRIVATSVQMIADGHHWEAWRMLPTEQARFYGLLAKTGANGVVLVSGDRHSAGLYVRTHGVPYPLLEITASSLNSPLSTMVDDIQQEPGSWRLGTNFYDANFGQLDIDWAAGELTASILDTSAQVVRSHTVRLDSLK